MDAIHIQAKFVVASGAQIYHPGRVSVREGRIVDVGPAHKHNADLDLGEVVLLPGLVNPHTHLEFSDLHSPLPAGASFPEWISQVVAHRRRLEKELGSSNWLDRLRQSIHRGLQESGDCGVVALADIVSMPWNTDVFVGAEARFANEPACSAHDPRILHHLQGPKRPRVLALPEMIGLTHERLDATTAWALDLYGRNLEGRNPNDNHAPHAALLGVGLSPHAPYSLQMDRVAQALSTVPGPSVLAMHVAESRDELEWLEQGTGAFKDSFERLGLPLPKHRGSIEDAIAILSSGQRALLIHGNYLSRAQAQQIAETKSISVVYCPRTHSHFGHEPYPIELYHSLEIPVLIGTDSRASNPDLNLWNDMVHARRRHSCLSPQQALHAVSMGPASALGIAQDYGSIAIGKRAQVNFVACQPHWNIDNLLEELTSSSVELQPLADSLL